MASDRVINGVRTGPNQPLRAEPKHPLGVAEERRGITQVANINGERDYLNGGEVQYEQRPRNTEREEYEPE